MERLRRTYRSSAARAWVVGWALTFGYFVSDPQNRDDLAFMGFVGVIAAPVIAMALTVPIYMAAMWISDHDDETTSDRRTPEQRRRDLGSAR